MTGRAIVASEERLLTSRLGSGGNNRVGCPAWRRSTAVIYSGLIALAASAVTPPLSLSAVRQSEAPGASHATPAQAAVWGWGRPGTAVSATAPPAVIQMPAARVPQCQAGDGCRDRFQPGANQVRSDLRAAGGPTLVTARWRPLDSA